MTTAYKDLVNPPVLTQPIYEPGKPIEMVAAEYGLNPNEIAKLASNESALGPSPMAISAIQETASSVHLYPDGNATFLRQTLSKKWNLNPDQFIFGNGSNEVLELIARAFLSPDTEAIIGEYGFIVYKLVTLLHGATPVPIAMPQYKHDLNAMHAAITERTRLIFIASPNNPTGVPDATEEIIKFAESLPDHVILVFDEAYAEYVEDAVDLKPLIAEGRKILCTRTFSKIYGLGGLRLGYGYGDAELVQLLNRIREPFNVNLPALAASEAALHDQAFLAEARAANETGKSFLTDGLRNLGLKVAPSATNFVLVEIEDPVGTFTELQKRGLVVRPLAPYGLSNHLRITIGKADENERLLANLAELLQ
ncbi:MAG: histidinol-phosphate transaminase [Verrucomicrobiota bacterium]